MYPNGAFNEEKDYLATKVPDLYITPEEHVIDLRYKHLYAELLGIATKAVYDMERPPLFVMATDEEIARVKEELRKAIDERFPEKEETTDES